MGKNSSTLLTAREIHGPYTQLLTNLQGERGAMWLQALNKVNKRINPWGDPLLEHQTFVLSGSPLAPVYDPITLIETLEKQAGLVIDESFKGEPYRWVETHLALGLWKPQMFPEQVFGTSDLLADEVTIDTFMTELRDNFWFTIEHAWFRLFTQLILGQQRLGIGGLSTSAPNLLFVNGGDQDRLHYSIFQIDVREKRWAVSALPHSATYQHKFRKGTRIITNSVW